ncbi:VanZ family protein [Chryseosolibacter indicus]|uniref:VanZ family protein n=1 Tax=Chryseosolibacter indicus TaxID=2782351 RepID=A0ABS5VL97_9BACT|nr:VanZ family protein [Chryseosolibacter indicus]MBT1702225.1 VanZ family protein [Chryseosolibacter indicus]
MLLKHCWPGIAWSLFILIITLLPGKAIPDVGVWNADKYVHFFIFGLLVILSAHGLTKSNLIKNKIPKPLLVAVVYSFVLGILIEVLQLFVPGRNFSFLDVVANSIGVALGYLIFVRFKNSIHKLMEKFHA